MKDETQTISSHLQESKVKTRIDKADNTKKTPIKEKLIEKQSPEFGGQKISKNLIKQTSDEEESEERPVITTRTNKIKETKEKSPKQLQIPLNAKKPVLKKEVDVKNSTKLEDSIKSSQKIDAKKKPTEKSPKQKIQTVSKIKDKDFSNKLTADATEEDATVEPPASKRHKSGKPV